MKVDEFNTIDSRQRQKSMSTMAETHYDVLVIGGGITGAGIALDCVSRGMKTALVEMQDYGAGTSSRSTKLIHGGLRYLKQFEFKLVSEVGRERAIIHRNAPHVVIPEGMLLPVYKDGTFGRLGVSVGLYIYDLLAMVKRDERRVMLSTEETLKREPLLNKKDLQGGGWYSEYRTDDARLTIEVIKTACREGAHCLNYAKAEKLTYINGRARGAEITDQISGTSFKLSATEVVNAAGPWVDEVRKLDQSLEGKRLQHTKGVHLVVNHERFPINESVYFDIDDGRMMFAIPRGKVTYFGTTDTMYVDNPGDPWCNRKDAEYLLSATNKMFPDVNLKMEDVRSSWAGIRPLIHEDGKAPGELSRKDEIIHSDSRLITIAGGKLTGFRKMAQRVTDLVQERLIESGDLIARHNCRTDKLTYSGGDFDRPDGVGEWTNRLAERSGIPKDELEAWVNLFGTNTEKIVSDSENEGGNALLESVLRYSIQSEGCMNIGDFLIRRSGMLYFNRDGIEKVLDTVKEVFQRVLGEESSSSSEFDREYQAVVRFREENFSPNPVV